MQFCCSNNFKIELWKASFIFHFSVFLLFGLFQLSKRQLRAPNWRCENESTAKFRCNAKCASKNSHCLRSIRVVLIRNRWKSEDATLYSLHSKTLDEQQKMLDRSENHLVRTTWREFVTTNIPGSDRKN